MPEQFHSFDDSVCQVCNTVMIPAKALQELRRKLAESQAREDKLRSAAKEVVNRWFNREAWNRQPTTDMCVHALESALTLTALEPYALREMLAEAKREVLLAEAAKAEAHVDYPTDENDIARNSSLVFLAERLRYLAEEIKP